VNLSVPSGAIEIERASVSYGPRVALREISFEIAPGQAVGYLGPNGAGKTTTLRLLAGLLRPASGSVRLLGLDPVRDHGKALRHVGVLVETPGVLPYVTARDLLSHVARVKHVAPSDEAAQLRSLAGQLGFLDQLDRPIGALSTGLTRRLLLAVALVGDPEILLLDEPTLGLDPAARSDLRRILRDLRGEGRTLLLSTHLLDDVEEVCHRVLFLRDGQIVGDEPVELRPVDAAGAPVRTLALRFAREVAAPELLEALGGRARVASTGPRELQVELGDDDGHQAEVIAAVVRAGLPLLTVTDGRATLGQRYLERVGREDPP
jgi:ABC-type multidrug transport system ATPase subunit